MYTIQYAYAYNIIILDYYFWEWGKLKYIMKSNTELVHLIQKYY